MASKVTILGSGDWGAALAVTVKRAGQNPFVWGRSDASLTPFMQGVGRLFEIPSTSNLNEALDNSAMCIVAVPAQGVRAVIEAAKPYLTERARLVISAKGLERATSALMSAVAEETMPNARIAVLSGPSFAKEVIDGRPTAVVVASKDQNLVRDVQNGFASSAFRPYGSDDVKGVDICGAVKNVLAIACGVVAGKELGDNPKAALITRGLAELGRLAEAVGGDRATVSGLSGLGDLVLTADSRQSRNMSFGYYLGRGVTIGTLLAEGKTTEGVWTAGAAVDLAKTKGVDAPICEAVHSIVDRGADIEEVVEALLSRPIGRE